MPRTIEHHATAILSLHRLAILVLILIVEDADVLPFDADDQAVPGASGPVGIAFVVIDDVDRLPDGLVVEAARLAWARTIDAGILPSDDDEPSRLS